METGEKEMKEKSASHSILGYEDILNCIVGKVRKTRKGNFVIPLVDIGGQEYGKVILEDNFDLDLETVENVSLQRRKIKVKK